MSATIVARTERTFTVQIEVPYADSMLDAEEAIQEAPNQAGVATTAEALKRFDTDGRPITVANTKLTSKGRLPKDYQTPTASRPSAATSTNPPAAARPSARSTRPPGSSSARPRASPR
jgi:hypothetical protein